MFRFCLIHDLIIRAVHGLKASQPKDEFRLAQAGSGKLFCSFLLFLGAVTFPVIIHILNTFYILNSNMWKSTSWKHLTSSTFRAEVLGAVVSVLLIWVVTGRQSAATAPADNRNWNIILLFSRCSRLLGHRTYCERQLWNRRLGDAHHQWCWRPGQHCHGLQVSTILILSLLFLFCFYYA